MKALNFVIVLIVIMIVLAFLTLGISDCPKCPEIGRVPTVNLPAVQKTTLSNGLQIWVVEQHEAPLVSLNLVFKSGSDYDLLGKSGVSSLTSNLLDEGTLTRSALQISDELEFMGASITSYSSMDASYVTMLSTTNNLDSVLDLFSDVVKNPAFAASEFDRIKSHSEALIFQQKDQPSIAATNAFNRILYDTHHPYGNNPLGTDESLKNISRDDVVDFFQTNYRPNNAVLIIVGDVKLDDVAQKIDRHFQDWKPAPVAQRTFELVSKGEKRKIFLIDKPGAVQSEIRIGYPALSRSTPDFFPVILMNNALGGQFNSRLNLNLREDKGYTYGIFSSYSLFKYEGPFMVRGSVITNATSPAIVEILKEIDKIHSNGITDEELRFAKNYHEGIFSINFETPAQISSTLSAIYLYNLSDDYFDNVYLQGIDKVSTEDVRFVAQKYLDSSRMTIVILGDVDAIKSDLESLNVGEVVVIGRHDD